MFQASTATHSRFAPWAFAGRALILLAGSSSILFGFIYLPESFIADGAVSILGVIAVFIGLLYAGLAACRSRSTDVADTILRLSLQIWFILLVAEGWFDRLGDEVAAYKGQFSIQAYGEVAIWIAAWLILLVIVLPHSHYLKQLIRGTYKWVTIFVIICFASVAYAPDRLYALAWCFKLGLVAMVVGLCLAVTSRLAQVILFLRVTLWGLSALTIIPLIQFVSDPASAFSGAGGRLEDPTLLSQKGALILLLGLILNSVQKGRMWAVVSGLGAAVMILALGKTAIVAGTIATVLFFLLQGKMKTGLQIVVAGIVSGGLMYLAVPQFAQYLSSYQGMDTLTGRTAIWTNAVSAIGGRPIVGHGYLASRFMWLTERGQVAYFSHLHNSFLDVFYNLGLLGFIPIVLMHFGIVRNIRSIVRPFWRRGPLIQDETHKMPFVLAMGCLALYVNAFINGLLTTSFGGRPTCLFMAFLAVILVADATAKAQGHLNPNLL